MPEMKISKKLLQTPLDDIFSPEVCAKVDNTKFLRTRTLNAIKWCYKGSNSTDIHTLSDFLKHFTSEEILLRQPNIGPKVVHLIKGVLESYGISILPMEESDRLRLEPGPREKIKYHHEEIKKHMKAVEDIFRHLHL